MKNRHIYFCIWDIWSKDGIDYVIYQIWEANKDRELRLSESKEFKRVL
jgi:hypothetical protein